MSFNNIDDLTEEFEDDLEEEPSLRPGFIDDYIGQEKLKHNLSVYIKAAKMRDQALDHLLFYGPPGLGKTTIAHIVSNELGSSLKCSSGPMLTKGGDLVAILTNLQAKDVLFIDEIHRLAPQVEEILYSAMEDYKVDIIIGQGPSARTINFVLAPFTLVGATTKAGLLASPLRDRFGVIHRLDFYSHNELELIIERSARILNLKIDKAGEKEIAKRSRGTPRIAIRLLKRIRDFAEVESDGLITKDIARNALLKLEVDDKGLDKMDRKLLLLLATNFSGGPVGIETIAAAISEEKETIEDLIEPYLLQEGFINRTLRGRVLTSIAYHHLGIKEPRSKVDNKLPF
ncbi:MAG: Holliday junction branch migration DNA helicase RuvB [Nitrospinota bacterium]